jgi:hypothetical protein
MCTRRLLLNLRVEVVLEVVVAPLFEQVSHLQHTEESALKT